MSVVALFSGSFCNGDEVARRVAQQLGVPLVDRQLIVDVAAQHGVAEDRLLHSMEGPSSILDTFRRDRARNVAYLREAVAELVRRDGAVLHGMAIHLIPRTIAHVFKACVIANRGYRVKAAMKATGLEDKKANKQIKDDDHKAIQWTQYLFDRGPWDERLFDEVIPMQTTSLDRAVEMLVDTAQSPAVQATDQSRSAAGDFVLAARVNRVLAEQGYDVDVEAADGRVTVVIKKHVLRMDKLETDLQGLAAAVEGVTEARTRLGPKVRPRGVHWDLDLDATPGRILLVDDEKEFVHTLSERLEARELDAAVAYNGEDALSFIDEQQPEVMVLDLKMPGIDGIEVLRRVKRDHPEVEVIILTGHGSDTEQSQADELGAFAYLKKPVDIEVLSRTMRQAYAKAGADKRKRGEGGSEPESEPAE